MYPTRTLWFPHLAHDSSGLYKLNWDSSIKPFDKTRSLSEAWFQKLEGLRFKVDAKTGLELTRLTHTAKLECSLSARHEITFRLPQGPQKTSPFVALVEQAFYLLVDCLWDRGTTSFMRGYRKPIYEAACLIRFWDSQNWDPLLYLGFPSLDQLSMLPKIEAGEWDDASEHREIALEQSLRADVFAQMSLRHDKAFESCATANTPEGRGFKVIDADRLKGRG